MGLDMELMYHPFPLTDEQKREIKELFPQTKGREIVDVSVKITVGYIKGAWMGHFWLLKEVGLPLKGGDEFWVAREDLEKLLKVCEEVLKDRKKAKKLLPMKKIIPFSKRCLTLNISRKKEYDKWYFWKVEQMKNMLKRVLEIDEEFYLYKYSW